jgi:hypothetical protein
MNAAVFALFVRWPLTLRPRRPAARNGNAKRLFHDENDSGGTLKMALEQRAATAPEKAP